MKTILSPPHEPYSLSIRVIGIATTTVLVAAATAVTLFQHGQSTIAFDAITLPAISLLVVLLYEGLLTVTAEERGEAWD